VIVPRFEAPRRLPDNAQIDPKIIARPPQVSVGVQPAGKMVAKNEFPNLELLPIKSGKSTERPIPAQWPDFKLKVIPDKWPKFEMLPVQAGTPVTPQPSGGR